MAAAPLAAFAALGLFIALMAVFGVISGLPKHSTVPTGLLVAGAVVGVAFHVALFPVVAALPAPSWARAAGYGWLVVDIASNVMVLNGVAGDTATALRYGGHIPAALWIAAASWQAGGVLRYVGVALAVCLGGFSFIAPWAPFVASVPSLFLMIAWLPLVGRALLKG